MKKEPHSAPRKKMPYFEVAFSGGGIRPETVPATAMARLVLDAMELLQAVADDRGVGLPLVFLRGVYRGSAAARLYPDEGASPDLFERVAASTYRAAHSRGDKEGAAINASLRKLYTGGQAGPGPIRIAVRNVRSGPTLRPFHLAEPIASTARTVRSTTILHGRIVGVEEIKDRVDIRVKVINGNKLRMSATSHAKGAIERFAHHARIRASVLRSDDGTPDDGTWLVESIEPWEPGAFLDGIDRARDDMRRAGVSFDLMEALESLHEDDDDD